MSYRHTLEAAIESLHEIGDLIKGFPPDGNIPVIELDLSLQKLRNVYELLLMIRNPVSDQTDAATSFVTEMVSETSNVEEKVPETTMVIEKVTETEITEVKTEVKVVTGQPVTAPVTDPERPGANVTKGSPRQTTQIISDRFKGRSTLHETLHQSVPRENSTLAHSKPVIHLMTAIGINDRFTFIRELFNNDAPAFENTMNILNEATSFNDAYNYMIQQHDWDMDSDAVQLLLEIIRRKHIVGRHE